VGQLISLTDRIAERELERERSARGAAAFFFAMDCPISYLVAERVERDLGEIAWVPILAPRDTRWARERLLQAKAVAKTKRLPLLEPENYPFDARPVTRAALYASKQGGSEGGAFALRAMRLAFAGGFDLSDPDLIAEAAAASGVSVDGALEAAEDASLDHALASAASGLRSRGIIEPPVIRIVSGWFSGFDALSGSTAFAAARDSYSAQAF
jgi:2-hydroxychromene-2-carboxylate isomerase